MKTTEQALREGFKQVDPGYHSFIFGDEKEYELAFEPLLWDQQMYVALYRRGDLLTEKIVVKPGYIKETEDE